MRVHMQNLSKVAAAVCSLGALCCGSAQAARPLATDDAAVNPAGVCQLEAWRDQDRGNAHHLHLAPACGVAPGLEAGIEWVRASPRDAETQGRGVALKWVPEWARHGEWQWGLKAGLQSETSPDTQRWQAGNWSMVVLASRPLSEQVDLHMNLGHQHLVAERRAASSYSVALAWRITPRWQAFAEVLGQTNEATQRGVAMRWWLLSETLGLDLTMMRTGSNAGSTRWGVGLGWYGLSF